MSALRSVTAQPAERSRSVRRSHSDGGPSTTAANRARFSFCCRGRDDVEDDAVEREHPPAAADVLDVLLRAVEDLVHDFERRRLAAADELRDRRVHGPGNSPFEHARFACDVHRSP